MFIFLHSSLKLVRTHDKLGMSLTDGPKLAFVDFACFPYDSPGWWDKAADYDKREFICSMYQKASGFQQANRVSRSNVLHRLSRRLC